MAIFNEHSIAYAEYVAGGVLIVFVDGESAVYPADYLRAALADMKSLRTPCLHPAPLPGSAHQRTRDRH